MASKYVELAETIVSIREMRLILNTEAFIKFEFETLIKIKKLQAELQ